MSAIPELRPSPIAGLWYPDDPEKLAREVDRYLDDAILPDLAGEVVGVIAPHAGHIYSGATAGHAFRSVRAASFHTVVLLSPLHGYHPAPFLTTAHKGYQTPLGPVWIDQDALLRLAKAMQARQMPPLTPLVQDEEHSIEIELPFLQRALAGEFTLLPVMIRTHAAVVLQALGEALAEILAGSSSLLVASSDLSHFYPLPVANRLDAAMLARMAQFAPQAVLEAEETGEGFACGVGAIAAGLWAARGLGANAVEIVHHSTSADRTGDESSVVGYGAAVILKRTIDR
jgi:AmmeMemoRadiSam system protein B